MLCPSVCRFIAFILAFYSQSHVNQLLLYIGYIVSLSVSLSLLVSLSLSLSLFLSLSLTHTRTFFLFLLQAFWYNPSPLTSLFLQSFSYNLSFTIFLLHSFYYNLSLTNFLLLFSTYLLSFSYYLSLLSSRFLLLNIPLKFLYHHITFFIRSTSIGWSTIEQKCN